MVEFHVVNYTVSVDSNQPALSIAEHYRILFNIGADAYKVCKLDNYRGVRVVI